MNRLSLDGLSQTTRRAAAIWWDKMQNSIKAIVLFSIPLALISWAVQSSAISTAASSKLCAHTSNHPATTAQSVRASNLKTEYSSGNESLNRLQDFFRLTLKS